MNGRERQMKIESYGKAGDLLAASLGKYPREMWQFKPEDGGWSVHEIVVHITDSEANSYVRCRRFIAEPGSSLMAYDENLWARELDYHAQSTDDAIELFRWLRKRSYELIRSLPEQVWSHQVHHPESGNMTMDDWLDTYEHHIPEHVAQMDTAYASWQRRQKAG
ncbi:MAG: DinB family protein [Chloroflexi bacterium]|nr:DinB family protein [Chloroflexota bacterium]